MEGGPHGPLSYYAVRVPRESVSRGTVQSPFCGGLHLYLRSLY